MDKFQTLDLIEDMKKSHLSVMHKIEMLIDGRDVDELVAVAKTECDFGKFLYTNEEHLKDILGALFYTKLETLHEKWHMEYQKIYNIFENYIKSKNEKKGFFAKLSGGVKVSEMDIDRAKLYYSDLKLTASELIKTIEMCQRRVSALSEGKFE